MFPVISILRRAAAKVIYVREASLERHAEGYRLPAGRLVRAFSTEAQGWAGPARFVRLYEHRVAGDSSEAVALALTATENQLARQLGLQDMEYTLIVGAESERDEGARVARRARFGLVKGTFCLAGAGLEPLSARGRRPTSTRRRLPRGAVVEQR